MISLLRPLPTSRQFASITGAFILSTILTGLFIRAYGGYVSRETMLFSGSIAGGKWAIQILAGLFLLGERRWIYIGQLSITCLMGSLVLLPFAVLSGGDRFFFGSLAVCIVVMSTSIVIQLKARGFSWRWPALWLALLAVAVSLQLTVVFHIL